MILKSIILSSVLLTSFTAGAVKVLEPSPGLCKGADPGIVIPFGKVKERSAQNADENLCVKKCLLEDRCVAMQYDSKRRKCSLYPEKVTVKEEKEGTEGRFFCGSVKQIAAHSAPTCEDSPGYKFGKFEWEGEQFVRTCAWITENEKNIAKRQKGWCGVKKNGSIVADKCPLACGRCEPKAPTPAKTCSLTATLAFPWGENYNDAPFFGYHADYLEVTMENDIDDWMCSWTWSDQLPSWCTYANSHPDGDSAYVANVDDYYADVEEEISTSETVVLTATAGKTYDFAVTHYFFDQDYYTDYDTWKDHMMVAVLKIKNESNEEQGMLKNKGWSHPAELGTSTHLRKLNGGWKVNPDYQGKFKVEVTCDDDCKCTSEYSLM